MEKTEQTKIITSPIKAIRAKCLDCCCGQANEVKLCTCKDCPLYAFRFGKNPYNTRQLTDEQRKAASERMKKVAEARKANKDN